MNGQDQTVGRVNETGAFFILGPAVAAPFWDFPALLKMILLTGANLVVIPAVFVVVIFPSNKKAVVGAYKSGPVRNMMMLALLAAAIAGRCGQAVARRSSFTGGVFIIVLMMSFARQPLLPSYHGL